MNEVYVSVDIETNGPIPGPNSMWSLASAAFRPDGTAKSIFFSNLKDLPGSEDDSTTLQFWRRQPRAYEAARANAQDPRKVMESYSAWLGTLGGKPVFVGYPASYDFLFVYWYLIKFTGKSPFGFSALDIKSYASAMLRLPFRESVKRNFPKAWIPTEVPHTHLAVDDALEQGIIFHRMRNANMQEPVCACTAGTYSEFCPVYAHQRTARAVKSRE